MAESDRKHKLIFLNSEDSELASLADSHFNTESERMELSWESIPRTVSSEAQGSSFGIELEAELDAANLIVVLSKAALSSTISERCRKWNQKIECWNFNDENALVLILKQKINELLIRLILKGGKRTGVKKEITCVQCNKVFSSCTCNDKKSLDKTKSGQKKLEVIRVLLERKGRGGKTVTVASGFALEQTALEELTTELKKACGSGGTLKDGQIEIQGDHRTRLMAELDKKGYRTKRVGS